MKRGERKDFIFQQSLKCAREQGIFNFSINDVAESSKCSPSLVKHYHGGIAKIRKAIINYGMVNKIDWIMDTTVSAIYQ
jgi:AcrR family transcriptional regulator